MESAIKQIARRIDRQTKKGWLTRQEDGERTDEFTGGRVRPHKGSGALLIRELIGMPRMPTTMGQGLGYLLPEGGGYRALASPAVTEGQAELTSRTGLQREISKLISPSFFPFASHDDSALITQLHLRSPSFFVRRQIGFQEFYFIINSLGK